jgi:Trk K+ transport system NAD-binding subunit
MALVGAGILAMICAVIKFDVNNFKPFYENTGVGSHNSFIGGMASILASVPFFLAGFETIPQGIESAGGDTKGVGKTVVITVVLSCIFYALLLFTLGGALPWKDFIKFSNPSAARMFQVLYPGAVGNVLYVLILFGAVCGLLTTWNGFMMASSQILMAMARVSIVPFSLSKQHPVYKTPINALKVSLAASLIGPFLGSGLIGSLTSFSAAGYVASWMITAFSLIVLRKKEPALKRPYKIPGGLPMAWFAAICMTGLFILLFVPGQPVFMGSAAILIFVAWMVVGGGLYLKDYRARKQYSLLTRTAYLFASMSESNATITMPGFVDSFESDYKVMSFVVPKEAEYAGKTLMELYWGRRQNVFIIKIERKTEIILVPGGSTHVYAGDRVFAVGVAKALDRFRDYQNVGEKYSVSTLKDFMGYGDTEKQSPLSCFEYRVLPTDTFCDQLIRESRIQDRYHLMIVGLKTPYSKILELPTATTLIEAGDILWMMGSEDAIDAFANVCRTEAEQKGETTTGLDI